jgi:hypothetical protein
LAFYFSKEIKQMLTKADISSTIERRVASGAGLYDHSVYGSPSPVGLGKNATEACAIENGATKKEVEELAPVLPKPKAVRKRKAKVVEVIDNAAPISIDAGAGKKRRKKVVTPILVAEATPSVIEVDATAGGKKRRKRKLKSEMTSEEIELVAAGKAKRKAAAAGKPPTDWMKHLKAFYEKNKGKMSYKQAMTEAKKTYKK